MKRIKIMLLITILFATGMVFNSIACIDPVQSASEKSTLAIKHPRHKYKHRKHKARVERHKARKDKHKEKVA